MSRLPSPALCLVTDRQRLAASYPEHRDPLARLLAQIEDAVAGGVDLVQIRERDLDARSLADLVARAVQLTRGTRARIVVNDRADVAVAAGADGVHLRGDSCPAVRVREIVGSGALVGRSVHSAADAEGASEAGGLDYLILGAVFPSASKDPDHAAIGPGEIASAARRVTVPVLAIGGIASVRLHDVAAAGAAGIAAIGYFVPPPGAPARRRAAMRELAEAARRAFDTPRTVS